jgi:2-polyprenyl-6-methoxyphenol hydroxylase-like FAD-dependent oxidoreductase
VVGDAGHATGPVWAQGAAMALEDALVLADLLSGSRDWSQVGRAFELARRPRVDHVRAATDAMSRLARLPGWVRDLTASALGPRAYRHAYDPLRAPTDVRGAA